MNDNLMFGFQSHHLVSLTRLERVVELRQSTKHSRVKMDGEEKRMFTISLLI